MIYIFTGGIDSGKTSKMEAQYKVLPPDSRGDGIISRKIIADGKTAGYDFVHLDGEMSVPGIRLKEDINGNTDTVFSIGRYSILRDGFRFAESILRQCITDGSKPVWIDEIGKLELDDGGFAGLLLQALKKSGTVYMTCRTEYLKEIIRAFSLTDYQVIACFSSKRTG